LTRLKPKTRNRIFITILVLSNTLGNVFLAVGIRQMPVFHATHVLAYAATFLTDAWLLSGIALLSIWMVAQLSMFTWADLSYVLPMTASAYVCTAVLGKIFLDDRISVERWAGIALISAGVMLVSATPPCTRECIQGERRP
jgi:uncharacterized membrane protein